MKLKLFGGLCCPDSLVARLAVVADADPAVAARMADHAITIMLLVAPRDDGDNDGGSSSGNAAQTTARGGPRHHAALSSPSPPADDEQKQFEFMDELNEFDAQNRLFFAQREMLAFGVARVAQALTAIHAVARNIVKYDVAQRDAVEELTLLGLSEATAVAIVAPVRRHRGALAEMLLRQTPTIACGSFVQPNAGPWARRLVVCEMGFGARAFQQECGAAQPFDIQPYTRRWPLQRQQQQQSSPAIPSSPPVDDDDVGMGEGELAECGVEWRLRGGLTIRIPAQKARALLAELVTARETLRHAWTPPSV